VFFKRSPKKQKPLISDFHSHLIPGIDDGVKGYSAALEIIQELKKAGVRQVVTTPHISQHAYPNAAENILNQFASLREIVSQHAPEIDMQVAAEYYLDESFQQQLARKEPLLTFGRKHLLFETNYLSEPFQMKEVVFQLVTQGYRPMLAHPERYHFLTVEKAADLRSRGVNLQLNLLSLIGFYSQPVQKLAEKLVDAKLINAVSSDFHQPAQAKLLSRVTGTKYFERALDLPLINFDIHA
jgi:tyrosine-protein phosphatase YwqE